MHRDHHGSAFGLENEVIAIKNTRYYARKRSYIGSGQPPFEADRGPITNTKFIAQSREDFLNRAILSLDGDGLRTAKNPSFRQR